MGWKDKVNGVIEKGKKAKNKYDEKKEEVENIVKDGLDYAKDKYDDAVDAVEKAKEELENLAVGEMMDIANAINKEEEIFINKRLENIRNKIGDLDNNIEVKKQLLKLAQVELKPIKGQLHVLKVIAENSTKKDITDLVSNSVGKENPYTFIKNWLENKYKQSISKSGQFDANDSKENPTLLRGELSDAIHSIIIGWAYDFSIPIMAPIVGYQGTCPFLPNVMACSKKKGQYARLYKESAVLTRTNISVNASVTLGISQNPTTEVHGGYWSLFLELGELIGGGCRVFFSLPWEIITKNEENWVWDNIDPDWDWTKVEVIGASVQVGLTAGISPIDVGASVGWTRRTVPCMVFRTTYDFLYTYITTHPLVHR